MSHPIPSSLALTAIANGQLGDATPVANNYSQIQAAVNALITALSGGTAGQFLQAVDGSDVAWFTKLAPSRQILTASGTYTTPANCVAILVECVGGGGAGGGTATGTPSIAIGGGASGGAYAAKLIQAPAASYSFTIGAAGAVGATGPNNGGNGGNSIFGASLVVAAGGLGGLAAASGSIAAGQDSASVGSSIGDLIIQGGDGSVGAGNAGSGPGGNGAGPYGGGMRRGSLVATNTSSNGLPGHQYGGGGGGGISNGSGGTTTGGAGASGVIVVTEYY